MINKMGDINKAREKVECVRREIFHVSNVRERNYFGWGFWTAEMKEEVRHRF